MVCGTTTCRMAGNPSRVAVKRREVVGLQGEDRRWSISVGPATKSSPFRHFQGQNARFQGRRRRNIHTDQIRKSLGGFSKISRHANRNKITVSVRRVIRKRFRVLIRKRLEVSTSGSFEGHPNRNFGAYYGSSAFKPGRFGIRQGRKGQFHGQPRRDLAPQKWGRTIWKIVRNYGSDAPQTTIFLRLWDTFFFRPALEVRNKKASQGLAFCVV